MTKIINISDISLRVNNDTEALKNLMQYYISLPVNNMTTEGKTALDSVEDNKNASDTIKEGLSRLNKLVGSFSKLN